MFAGYSQVYGAGRSTSMTIQGTIGKTFALLGFLSATALWTWSAMRHGQVQPAFLVGAGIGGFILSLITIFRPTTAPGTAPVYAAFEGVILGGISYVFENALGKQYPGIALEAVSMTAGTLFVMLFLFSTRIVRVTERLRAGITSAVGAILLIYIVSMIARLFGASVPFLDTPTPIGIGISVFIVGVAAFKLLLDFDFIEKAASAGAPRYMEWYAAFGLMLSLIWLYIEILHLLLQLQQRRDED
jgi:uncharacterized YccA/Bax inhibitor family protein